MNKRILSLVCIALYALLDVSVHCAQHKEYDVGNESARDTEEISRSNEKNGIKFNHKIQLKNNDPKDVDDKDDEEDEKEKYGEDDEEDDEEDEEEEYGEDD
ncbi:fam-c protein, partial [Plasmodium chabaudi chabaudi]